MARRLYNRGDAAWTTDVGAATALERLRDLRMVDRNTGISLTDAQVDTPGTVGGLDWNPVTVTINSLVQIAQPLYLVNKHIILTDAGRLRANTGGYIQFFNCTIEVTSGGGSAHTAAQQPFNDGIDANTGGHVAGQGSHFYGSTMFQNHPVDANLYLSMLDGMNSDFAFAPAANFVSVSLMPAARMINASIYGQAVDSGAITYYNAPSILEGVRIGGVAFEGNTGANSTNLILEPDFTDLTQVRKFFLQNNTSSHSLFQQAGFFSWPSNTLADIIHTGGNTNQAYLAQNNTDRGGVIGYYGWRPEISLGVPSRDADGLLTNGVQGVNVRVGSGAILTATTAGTSAANNVGTRLNFGTAQDQTGNAIDLETEYVTDTNGVAIIDANTRYSSDGWDAQPLAITGTAAIGATTASFSTSSIVADSLINYVFTNNGTDHTITDNTTNSITFTPQLTGTLTGNLSLTSRAGWVDWLKLGVENDTAQADNPGGNILGQNFTSQNLPDNTAIVPLQVAQNRNVRQYPGRIQLRGYGVDVDFESMELGTVGTGAGQQTANSLVEIEDVEVITTSLSGVRVKASNVNADNTPNLSFDSSTPASLQDISNAVRSGWSQYEFDPHYTADASDDFPSAGPFNANTYPMNIVLSDTAPTVAGNITFVENGYGIGLNGNVVEVAVQTNSLSALSDDILNNNPSNVQSIRVGGRNISGITYNGTTTGDFGAVSGSNITTDNSANQSIASINGSTISAEGQLTVSGTTVESTVTSTGSHVLFNGNINAGANESGGSATANNAVSALNITVNNFTMTSTNDTTTLTGSTADNLTVSSGNNIVTTDATIENSSLTATGNVNGAGSGEISDTSFDAATVFNLSIGKLGNGNTYDVDEISFTTIANNTVTTMDDLIGSGRTITGSLALTNSSGNTVTITISDVSDYAGIEGVSVTQGNTQTVRNFIYNFPAEPAEPRTFTIPSTLAGKYIISGGSFSVGTVLTKGSGAQGAIITTNNEDSNTYKIWWKPTSTQSGSDAPAIYDYSYTTWSPGSEASSTNISDFQPDPSSAVTASANQKDVITFGTPTYASVSDTLTADITSTASPYTAAQSQTAGWQYANTDGYLMYVAGEDLNNTSVRPIRFGVSASGIPTVNFIAGFHFGTASGAQQQVNGWNGFTSVTEGSFPEVISATSNVIYVSGADVTALTADSINTLGNELKQNQSNLKEGIESNPYNEASNLPFNTAD